MKRRLTAPVLAVLRPPLAVSNPIPDALDSLSSTSIFAMVTRHRILPLNRACRHLPAFTRSSVDVFVVVL